MGIDLRAKLGALNGEYLSLTDKFPKLTPFVLGCLFSLSFEPFGVFPLVFIIIPLLLSTLWHLKDWGGAFKFGWWFGFGHFLTSLFWIGNSFLTQSAVPIFVAPLAVLGLAFILAYFFAIMFSLVFSIGGPKWTKIFIFSSIWSILEWTKGHIFTGFPWNPLGVIWGPLDTVMQSASIFGVFGLTFVTIMIASSLALLLSQKKIIKAEMRLLIFNFVVFILIVGYGANRLSNAMVTYHPNLDLRIVQANISQKEKWVRKNWSKNFFKHIEMSKKTALNRKPPSFVIWPETAIPYFIGSEPGRQVLLAEMLKNKSSVISGAPRLERLEGSIKLFNSVHVIGKDGRLKGTYDKVHLVPFGEYLPMRWMLGWLGLEKLTEGSLDFTAGNGLKSISVPGIPSFGVLVCYEVIFPGQVVGPDRPNWLLNVTNDGWFGNSPGPYQHFSMARFRAVEEGLPLIRSAGTGISAVIDPWGRVLSQLRINESGVLDSKLPKRIENPTIYSLFGDYIIFFIVFFGLIIPLLEPIRLHFNTKDLKNVINM